MTSVRCSPPRAQRGAVSLLMVALMATIGIAALVSIDVGHVFWRQRQLQAAADLTALAAAQQLRRADGGAPLDQRVLQAAQFSAGQNGFAGTARATCDATRSDDGVDVCVGIWDPGQSGPSGDARHFRAWQPMDRAAPNAVQVALTQTVPVLFVLPGGRSRQLRAGAIATSSAPVAAFSVGSGLLDVESSRGLLSLLLGHSVALSAMDWSGLLDTTVTLEQLRVHGGVATIDELLGATLSLSEYYRLVLGAASKDTLLDAMLAGMPAAIDAGALAAGLAVGKVVDLGVLASGKSSAADARLNVAALLMLGAQIANARAALDLTAALPALPGSLITLRMVEPPRLAVGPVQRDGNAPSGWRTTAVSAQLDLSVQLPLGAAILDTRLEHALRPVLTVPLLVQLARSEAALTGLRCAAAREDRRAVVETRVAVGKVCLARRDAPTQCADTAVDLFSGDLGLAKVAVSVAPQRIDIPGNAATATLAPGDRLPLEDTGAVATLILDLITRLNLDIAVTVGGHTFRIAAGLGDVVDGLAPVVTSVLGPPLDRLLASVGVRVAGGDLWLHDVDCDNTELVY